MNKAIRLLLSLVILLLLGVNTTPMQARPLTALVMSQMSPASCPPGGCAAGQRINFRATFDLNPLNTTTVNTQVCVFTSLEGSDKWADGTVFSITDPTTYSSGEQSGICTANIPGGTQYLGGAYAQFSTAGSKNFDFAFRINKNSTIDGSLQISIYRLNAAGDAWEIIENESSPIIDTTPSAITAYVAADVTTCNGESPCYLNSGDDLANGIGTGLKDAVDARTATSTINILGSYAIKGNSVTVDAAHTIQGVTNAALTYSGSQCSNAMLLITGGATIQDLNINDGVCVSPSRDLVLINSPANVTLRRNDLMNGKDAISIMSNSGDVLVRFNQIVNNSGYGLLRGSGSGSGTVNAIANNIFNNRSGYQIVCNNKGTINHNFLGAGILPNLAISNCSYTIGKQLGAAINKNTTKPGVEALEEVLTGSKTSYFNNMMSISGTPNVKVILINHGNGTFANIPFLGIGTDYINSCNNFYDVFISDENTEIPSFINLSLTYDLNLECINTIESSVLCGSTDQANYPLFWYDPQNSVTERWDTTGQIPSGLGASGMVGQTTTCDLSNREVTVEINNNIIKRPNLITDLFFTPFGIGYYNQEYITFSDFYAIGGIEKIDLNWETINETGLSGFYVTRSLNINGPYNRDSDFIPRKGNDEGRGGIYYYSDTGLDNGTTYWYMLELLDSLNNTIEFHGPISATTYSLLPTATDVTPNSAEVYGPSLSIKIKGNNFLPNSVVVWDDNLGINLNSSYINATEMTAIIPSSLLSSSSLHELTVYNPGAGGGFSPPLTFTIKNPVPVLVSRTPTVTDGNFTALTVDLTGDNFVSTSKVRFNGSDTYVEPEFIDRNHLRAKINRQYLSPGIIQITVFNPAYGGGTSAALTLNLYTPTPTLTKQPTSTKTRTVVYTYRSPTPQRTPTRTPTRTLAGTLQTTPSATPGLLTPSATLAMPDQTLSTQVTPEQITLTPSLAPGEPTYTPAPPTPVIEDATTSVWNWRLMSGFRVLAGILLGAGLLSFPAFLVFRRKTRQKTPR
jgi:hypothetical protein